MDAPIAPTLDGVTADPQGAPSSYCARCGAPQSLTPCACQQRETPALTARADVASIRASLALYFSLLGVCALGRLVSYLNDRPSPDDLLRYDVVVSGLISAIVLIAAAVAWRRTLPVLSRVGPARWIAMAPMAAVATYALATVLINAFDHLIVPSHGEARYITELARAGWWVPVLLTCVQPAVFEELAFRGCIQGSLTQVLSRRDAIVVTALMFAILHLSFFSLPHLLVMGLALGYIRDRSGSLYPGMVLHFCHNLFVVLNASGGPT